VLWKEGGTAGGGRWVADTDAGTSCTAGTEGFEKGKTIGKWREFQRSNVNKEEER
jgi:hypothetical protein